MDIIDSCIAKQLSQCVELDVNNQFLNNIEELRKQYILTVNHLFILPPANKTTATKEYINIISNNSIINKLCMLSKHIHFAYKIFDAEFYINKSTFDVFKQYSTVCYEIEPLCLECNEYNIENVEYHPDIQKFICKVCDCILNIPYLIAIQETNVISQDPMYYSLNNKDVVSKDLFAKHIGKVTATQKYIDQYNAMKDTEIIRKYINNYHSTNKQLLDVDSIRAILKILQLAKYNEYASIILKQECGINIPQLNESEYEKLESKFINIDLKYNDIKYKKMLTTRKYYPYIIYKIIQQYFKDNISMLNVCKLIHIPNKKSLENIDYIWYLVQQ